LYVVHTLTRNNVWQIELIITVATAAGAGRTATGVVHTEVASALVGTCIINVGITASDAHVLLRFAASLLTLYGVYRKVAEEAFEAIAVIRTREVTLDRIAGVTFTEHVVGVLTISDTVALMCGVSVTLCT
jgi:hypothetical protein